MNKSRIEEMPSQYIVIKDGAIIRSRECFRWGEAEEELKPDRAAGERLFTEVPEI